MAQGSAQHRNWRRSDAQSIPADTETACTATKARTTPGVPARSGCDSELNGAGANPWDYAIGRAPFRPECHNVFGEVMSNIPAKGVILLTPDELKKLLEFTGRIEDLRRLLECRRIDESTYIAAMQALRREIELAPVTVKCKRLAANRGANRRGLRGREA